MRLLLVSGLNKDPGDVTESTRKLIDSSLNIFDAGFNGDLVVCI